MALNKREEQFVDDVRTIAQEFQILYAKAFRLKESFAEEFKSSQDNALDDNVQNWRY